MSNVTTFDTKKRYIFLVVFVTDPASQRHEFDGLLDSGAPTTEFSDPALQYAGLLEVPKEIWGTSKNRPS